MLRILDFYFGRDFFVGFLIGAHLTAGSGEVETDFSVGGRVGVLEKLFDHLSVIM